MSSSSQVWPRPTVCLAGVANKCLLFWAPPTSSSGLEQHSRGQQSLLKIQIEINWPGKVANELKQKDTNKQTHFDTLELQHSLA